MIFRNRHEKNFTVLSNEMLNDKTISFKARGLLSFMLSRPTDWQFYYAEIESHSDCDGGTSIMSGIRELIKAGYVTRKQTKGTDGKWNHCAWDVWEAPQAEKPCTEKPYTEKPCTEKPCTENPPLLSTNRRIRTERKGSNNKEKGFSEKDSFDPEDLPAHLGKDPSITEAWIRYVQSRREKNQKITQIAYKMLVKKMMSRTPEEIVNALDRSVMNGWTGVFFNNDNPAKGTYRSPPQPDNDNSDYGNMMGIKDKDFIR